MRLHRLAVAAVVATVGLSVSGCAEGKVDGRRAPATIAAESGPLRDDYCVDPPGQGPTETPLMPPGHAVRPPHRPKPAERGTPLVTVKAARESEGMPAGFRPCRAAGFSIALSPYLKAPDYHPELWALLAEDDIPGIGTQLRVVPKDSYELSILSIDEVRASAERLYTDLTREPTSGASLTEVTWPGADEAWLVAADRVDPPGRIGDLTVVLLVHLYAGRTWMLHLTTTPQHWKEYRLDEMVATFRPVG